MNQRIIYTNSDGGVSVIVPAGSIEACMKDIPAGAQYAIVDVSTIPSDRTFRNAWVKNGNAVGHDLNKAKNIAHDKRRAKRTEEFAPLDVEATIPAKATQAEAKRQQVRDKYADIQNQIDAAADVQALKAIVEAL